MICAAFCATPSGAQLPHACCTYAAKQAGLCVPDRAIRGMNLNCLVHLHGLGPQPTLRKDMMSSTMEDMVY
jgi:hypothetical protein